MREDDIRMSKVYWGGQDEQLKGNCGRFSGGSCECRRPMFNPWVGKIPWRRAWQPTLVLLPRESPGQRSLAGCSPQGRTEKDMTEEAKQQWQQGDCSPRVEASRTRFCSVHDGQPASQAKRGSSEQQIKILVFKKKMLIFNRNFCEDSPFHCFFGFLSAK